MITWIISGILATLLLTSCIIIRNLYIQNLTYERYVEDSGIRFFEILDEVREKVSESLSYMRELDQREMFEKDDEVGVVFTEIINVLDKLNKELEIYAEETEEEN